MAHPFRCPATNTNDPTNDLPSPFGTIEGLDRADYAEAAYEVFFTACRSSPGFGSRNVVHCMDEGGDGGGGSPVWKLGSGMAVTSRVKRALGLKMVRRVPSSRRTYSYGGCPSSPTKVGSDGSWSASRLGAMMPSRQMTAAEIMRQQMRVTEESDNRLRKALMRTLVGQIGRRAETIILPLELLRHLKPSEFKGDQEYHLWQKQQLRILKVGLLLHPSIPLDKSDASATKLEQVIEAAESKAIDTGKNSKTMRTLCNCVVSLAWRSPDEETTEVCHWVNGYPLNVEICMSLLHAVFDTKDGTLVLDEVDELLELMEKTWSMLGINKLIHNLCFTWMLFKQYIVTGQVEPDLLSASHTMLTQVANDAKMANKEPIYVKMLVCVLSEMKKWCENRLLDYHAYFNKETKGLINDILPLVSSVSRILEEDLPSYAASPQETKRVFDDQKNVDTYIRSSSRNAFAKMIEDHKADKAIDFEPEIDTDVLMQLAGELEELAKKEKDMFSPILRKWHPVATGVSIATLHTCYGELLKQYLSSISNLTNETIFILQRAGNLEKALTQMILEDSVEYENGGKPILQEMTRYNVDMVINRLLKEWIDKRLSMGNEILQRAKETETWNPKSKTEPFAQSATELVQFARDCFKGFFSVPLSVSEILVQELSDGLENLLLNYITFIASCGSKQNYIPSLPPLTRYRHDSRILKLWKRVACNVGFEESPQIALADEQNHTRPSTSRGTQRLYIRLNTLHYLLQQLHFLDKVLSLPPKASPQRSRCRKQLGSSYFEKTRIAIQEANQHVSEVAAYRLIFLDSISILYGSLYMGDVVTRRIRPELRILKLNITLLCAIVVDRAQPLALKELMKATFEAFLMVLLAGGSLRVFSILDHPIIEEDFLSLKRLFYTCTDGLIGGDEVNRESKTAEGIVALMGQSTEQLVEECSTITHEAIRTNCAIGVEQSETLPTPPNTTQWDMSNPTTILRILCHRKDRVASHFLKKTFLLARSMSS